MKLDLGCGKNKKEGFLGVDVRPFEGVDMVHDLAEGNWPWPDDSVEEVHCSHFLEHLTAPQRITFVNELYRVLKKDAKATLIVPHWASNRAYGDLTHQWPPVCEMWLFYLSREWREQNAPHNDFYDCDFLATWGYSLHPALDTRNEEYRQHAVNWFKEAAQDIIATLTKR